MNEFDVAKTITESSITVILLVFIWRMEVQRSLEVAARSAREKELSDARAEDARFWAQHYAQVRTFQERVYQSREPTKLE